MSFQVRVKPKSSGNRFLCKSLPEPEGKNCSKLGFTIDGQELPILFLNRYQPYTFEIDAPGHPFYFTGDEIGAKGDVDPLSLFPEMLGTDSGMINVIFDETHPNEFYYQCEKHPRMGGKVRLNVSTPQFTNQNMTPQFTNQNMTPQFTNQNMTPQFLETYNAPTEIFSDHNSYLPNSYLPNSYLPNSYLPNSYLPNSYLSDSTNNQTNSIIYQSNYSERAEYLIGLAELAQLYGFIPIPIWNGFSNYSDINYSESIKLFEDAVNQNMANNIGILTGSPSNIVVLEVNESSIDWMRELVDLNGGIPETLIVDNGNLGMQIYFEYEPNLQNMNLIDGLDINFRTDGEIVLFPGSINYQTEMPYEIISGYQDQQIIIGKMPNWLLEWLEMDRF